MKLLLRTFVPLFMIMSLSAQMKTARGLADQHDRVKVKEITSRKFTHAQMLSWLQPLETAGAFSSRTLGSSAEGRAVLLLQTGSGPTTVLLWSQMHGDESTATMGILDILNFFALQPEDPMVKTLRENLTILIIPMLNPDGAERFQRRSAQLIDLNRDALRLGTPEAAILKKARDTFKPQFGFNLHDQDPRYTVGQTPNPAAMALLAPAFDEARSDNEVRLRAKKLAARMATTLASIVPGLIARYDDTYEPRAFGDNIQKWGTSTVLLESGGWKNDPEKMVLRKLNFVVLLDALAAIATEEYSTADVSVYDKLPFNGKNLYDIVLRGATLKAGTGIKPLIVDIGINLEEKVDSTGSRRKVGTIMDVGDLSTFGAYEEFDCAGVVLDSNHVAIERTLPKEEILKMIGNP